MLAFRPASRPRAAWRIAIATASVLVCAPARAQAQVPPRAPPTEEQDRAARAEFLAGRDAFTRGAFDDAARRFEHAFELSGRVPLLYNLGTAYDRLHRWREARDAFGRYLDAMPNAGERAEVRARLAVIDDEIRREDRATSDAVTTRPTLLVHDRRPAPVAARNGAHPWRTAALVTGGLAVVAGMLSGGVAIVTGPFYEGLVHSCGVESLMDGGCDSAMIDEVNTRALLVNVFLATAVTFGVGAGSFLAVDLAQPAHAPAVHASIAPLGGGGAAVVFAGAL